MSNVRNRPCWIPTRPTLKRAPHLKALAALATAIALLLPMGPVASESLRNLTRGDHVVESALMVGHPQLDSGAYYAVHGVSAEAGDFVHLVVSSIAFDTWLMVSGPDGFRLENDDRSPYSTDSELRFQAPATGFYRIVVTSFAPGMVGPWRMDIWHRRDGEVVPSIAVVPGTAVVTIPTGGHGSPISATAVPEGATVHEGELLPGTEQLSSGEFINRYPYEAQAGDAAVVTLTSSAFDTYLLVTGPNGFQEDNDDAPGMGTNSRLELHFPEAGTYWIGVTSYAPGETGAYRLQITPGSAALERRRGRIFAVAAGVAHYPHSSDLRGTDDDAVKLFEALRRTGLLAPESTLLVNHQVTREGLDTVARRVASAAGPDDVFLFFFSGHGNQVPARSTDELNGYDETIEAVDGPILDDEVAAWFDLSEARLSIIVLDSCFAGGFARDVISGPGRMGIFSSEEDVLSMVADRFEAGGYLSHFLQEALLGAADREPRDGVITVGELIHYLRDRWASDGPQRRVDTGDGARTYQHLVIERGGVSIRDVVLYDLPADTTERAEGVLH